MNEQEQKQQKRKEMSLIAMEIILHAGDAKLLVDRALEKMAQMDFEGAEKLLEQADEEMLKAHNCQTDIIQDEASGSEYPNCLLFNHSQDTLMSCMSHFSMAKSLLMILRSFAGRLDELNKEGGKCR